MGGQLPNNEDEYRHGGYSEHVGTMIMHDEGLYLYIIGLLHRKKYIICMPSVSLVRPHILSM